jgi:hypothetical protein
MRKSRPVSAGSPWASLTGAARTLEQVSMNPLAPPLRLAEAAGVLSLATDLAMGQPLEHGLRTAMLALRLAQAMGLSEDDQVTVFYTGLLHFAGCTAESEIDARFFGDEMAARPRMLTVAHGSRLELIATAMRRRKGRPDPGADRGAHPRLAPRPGRQAGRGPRPDGLGDHLSGRRRRT